MQNKAKWILAGGIGLAIGLVVINGGFQSTPHTTTQQQPSTNNVDDISKLQQSLQNLQAQIQQQPSEVFADTNQILQISQTMMQMQKQITLLKESMEHIELQQAQPQVKNAHAQDSQGLSQWEQELQREQRQQQQADLFVEQIQQELTDPSWSLSAEQETLGSLSQVSDKLQVNGITCKSSICQLDIARVSGGSDDEALDAFETSIGWDGEMALTYDPVTGQGTVFMARPGYNLPRLGEGS